MNAASARPTIRMPGRVLVAAAGLGALGQLLFFDVGLGINVPIAIAAVAGAGWIMRRRSRWPTVLEGWLAPAALVFAVFAAVRDDPVIVSLDLLTAIALTGGALAAFSGRRVVSQPFSSLAGLTLNLIGWALGGASHAISAARAQRVLGPSRWHLVRPMLPLARGLLVAIPVAAVFVILFASADAVFASILDDLLGFDVDLSEAVWRFLVALLLGWLAAGGLALATSPPDGDTRTSEVDRLRVGTTELITVVIAVDLVFAVFVALQGAYLFGGLDTVQAAGISYADYARRGFFELVAVAALAGSLIIAVDRVARTRGWWLVGAAIALTLLTGIVLVSATLRLRLYQEAYGWTELRLYVLATIVVLAIAVIGLAVALLTDRVRWMGHALIVAMLGGGLVLNLLGPARFITEQNVARALDPAIVPPDGRSGLDVNYAGTLGNDGVPELIRALPGLSADDARRLAAELRFRLTQLRNDDGLMAWQAWNVGRATARDALERADAAGQLP